MRLIYPLMLTLFLSACNYFQPSSSLFLIREKDKYGYINRKGEIVIAPRFYAADKFSEGLSAVRLEGTYGYINQSGEFIITPRFDYALSFSSGIAQVYENGVSYFIDKTGHKLFDCPYYEVSPFVYGKARVYTRSGKIGIIDLTGKLVIDTIYQNIYPFSNGYATAYKKLSTNEQLLIDTLGRPLSIPAQYKSASPFGDGFFRVTFERDSQVYIGITNALFQLKFSYHVSMDTVMDYGFTNGLAPFTISGTNDIPPSNSYIDTSGKPLFTKTNFNKTYPFADNRAFVELNNPLYERQFRIIDTRGKYVTKDVYDYASYNGFKNGTAIVSLNGKYGIIDTSGHFILPPKFGFIAEPGLIGDYIFFRRENYDEAPYGVANRDGKVIIPASLQQYDQNGFVNGLLACVRNNRFMYLDEKGNVVWQEQDTSSLYNLNIDYKTYANYTANGAIQKDFFGIPTMNEDANPPKQILPVNHFPEGKLTLSVDTTTHDTLWSRNNAFRCYIANTTGQPVVFETVGHLLFMRTQALNKQKEWVDIEYLPRAWCGNAYSAITLPTQEYWQFSTPVYAGSYKTRLRISLEYRPATLKNGERSLIMYSNEFEGSINPAQLWRIAPYYRTNIMDPFME